MSDVESTTGYWEYFKTPAYGNHSSYHRQELGHRLDAERFTYSLIHAFGTESYQPEEWKTTIAQRLEHEHIERIFQRTPRH